MKDIRNYNSKQELHGYQERYLNDKLYYRANWRYDCCIGYEEWSGMTPETNFYIR